MYRIINIESELERRGIICQIWVIRPGGYLAIQNGMPAEYLETASANYAELINIFERILSEEYEQKLLDSLENNN